ncbi:MAG: chemotaxis protein CheB [Planctomycetota bacterium]
MSLTPQDGPGGLPSHHRPSHVIALGASAGGLASVQGFFEAMPMGTGLAFVLIQHLSPDHKSLMKEILSRHTKLQVDVARDGQSVESDSVYLIPPAKTLAIRDGVLFLMERDDRQGRSNPIDLFFESLAHDFGDRAIGVIFSGTGSDGTQGIRAIKHYGGLVMVQDSSAAFDGMPRSAIGTGLADFVLPPDMMPRRLLRYVGCSRTPILQASDESNLQMLERILAAVAEKTAVDLTRYKPQSLAPRIEKRMRVQSVENLDDYYALLQSSANEAHALMHELLIGVTLFFRDPGAFEALRREVLPVMFESLDEHSVLRVWVPACSTGEEAYSLAMVIDEFLSRSAGSQQFKIFATDLDDRAIRHASAGFYARTIDAQLTQQQLLRYFAREGDGYRVTSRIRDRVVFAKHNVVNDPAFTRIDLLSCRNMLTYLQSDLQDKVLANLCYSLRAQGFLMLGATEALGPAKPAFHEVDAQWRIYRKRSTGTALPLNTALPLPPAMRAPMADARSAASSEEAQLYEKTSTLLLSRQGDAAAIIDEESSVRHVFGRGSEFLTVPEGTPTQDITRLLTGDLRMSVIRMLREAKEGQTGLLCEVSRRGRDSEPMVTRATLDTIPLDRGRPPLFLLTLQDLGAPDPDQALVRVEPPGDNHHLRDLEAEIASMREHLQSTIEALETANEELQSTNEELIASNEELQSTNEELHSVNEELHTVNTEHQRKLGEQEMLTSDLEHLLKITEIGTIFLDSSFRVRKFTPAIAKIAPLMQQDIGRPIANLNHGLVDVDLVAQAKGVVASGRSSESEAQSADGKHLLMRAVPYRDQADTLAGVVFSFVDITAIEETRKSLAESESRFRQIAENISEIFWMRDPKTQALLYVSPAFERLWRIPADKLLQDPSAWFEPIHASDRGRVEQAYAEDLSSGRLDIEYRITREEGAETWIRDRGFPIHDEAGQLVRVTGLAQDVTSRHQHELTLRRNAETLDSLANTDPLTELANRRGLERTLNCELERCRRGGGTLVAVLADCDDFKSVNDGFGHAVGDIVLREISQRLLVKLRPTDHLARVGGDEFLALLPDTRPAEAYRLAERLRLSVTDVPLVLGDNTLQLSASFGVAPVPPDLISLDEVLGELHSSLATSKRGGKNRVSADDATEAEALQGNIVDALRRGTGFRVFAQPLRRLADGEIVGYELLSRGPAGVFEAPDDFFRLSIENNILTLVDLACLKNCLRAALAGQDAPPQRHGQPRFHVNLYPSTLLDATPDRLASLFENRTLATDLCLELSEQQFIGEPTYLAQRVKLVRDLGVKVALDDVGFGRSSLEALVTLEPDLIKIDRGFVQGCAEDAGKRRTLQRLLHVADSLSASVIAEGIETEDDRTVLLDLGVGVGQGFLWEPPSSFAA